MKQRETRNNGEYQKQETRSVRAKKREVKVQNKVKKMPDPMQKPRTPGRPRKYPKPLIPDSQALSSPEKSSENSPMPSQEPEVPP